MSYPRALTDKEREVLSWLLPDAREGYSELRRKALSYQVIGEGRWGTGDLVLAQMSRPIDRTLGMEPIAARGEVEFDHGSVTVSVNEENPDGQIEFEVGGELVGNELGRWCYSYWQPGDKAPATKETVREVLIYQGNYVLGISPLHKTIWLHHLKTGYNQLLAVTGFYESLLRVKPPTVKEQSLTPRQLFENLSLYSDAEFREALLHYNDEARKFDASMVERPKEVPQTFWDVMKNKIFGAKA